MDVSVLIREESESETGLEGFGHRLVADDRVDIYERWDDPWESQLKLHAIY